MGLVPDGNACATRPVIVYLILFLRSFSPSGLLP
jgi:hypothetical protein